MKKLVALFFGSTLGCSCTIGEVEMKRAFLIAALLWSSSALAQQQQPPSVSVCDSQMLARGIRLIMTERDEAVARVAILEGDLAQATARIKELETRR